MNKSSHNIVDIRQKPAERRKTTMRNKIKAINSNENRRVSPRETDKHKKENFKTEGRLVSITSEDSSLGAKTSFNRDFSTSSNRSRLLRKSRGSK